MEILDERGRLFGRVNVVDALVVLLGLAVVVAGAALVVGDNSSGPDGNEEATGDATRYATLDLGTHPTVVASLVRPGNATLDGVEATVTDVYRSPRSDNRVLLVARVGVEGELTDDGFRVADKFLRYGSSYTLATPDYQIGTHVTTTGSDPELRTQRVRTTVVTNVSAAVASSISTGDAQRIANDSVATVESVETVDSGSGWRVLRIELSLLTRPIDGTYEYAGEPIRVGRTLTVRTTDYQFRGEVVGVEP